MNGSLDSYHLSSRVSADPYGGRHAERRHPVEHVAANFCLGPLIGQSSGVKPRADDGLVAFRPGSGDCSLDDAANLCVHALQSP